MDTLLVLKDTITAHVVKVADSCQPCAYEIPTNCQDVIVVAIICGAIVLITLIVAISLLFYFCKKSSKLRKQKEAERIKAKENEWFSLRKEYQGNLLDYLKAKDDSKGINKEYLDELRDCIKWIDEQKKIEYEHPR